jgi:hypothetical protein
MRARSIRALTHPVRLALLECLGTFGELTATQAAEHIGESPTTCSFHFRQLAHYGFVLDAGSAGKRERPWRLAQPEIALDRDTEGSSALVVGGLEALLHSRAVARWEDWRRGADAFGPEWKQGAPFRAWVVRATPSELRELDERIRELLEPLQSRTEAPAAAVPVQVVAYAHPLLDIRDGD